MKDGDIAGLGLLQKNYGLIGVRIEGNNKVIVMINAGNGNPEEAQIIPLEQKTIFLKAECNFTDKRDVASFYYSLDEKTWIPAGTQLKMAYTIPQFIGYRFTLFNYATKETGGFADFDYYHISDKLSSTK
jgi:beta-xylosidase